MPRTLETSLRFGTLTAAVLLAAILAIVSGGAATAQVTGASCASQLNPGGTVNTPDTVKAGAASPLPTSWPARRRGLPEEVALRGTAATYNRLYEFALREGKLYAHRRGGSEPWRAVPLPGCLQGNLTAISADDDEMIGLDRDRQIYAMDNALKDPAQWNWSSRWGPPIWQGDGFKLPAAKAWSWSVISPAEDLNWTDPAGNLTPVGTYKVSHIWGLRDGGRVLSFWDPWLPRDNSYGMCGPHRGRFRAANISASGSHVFVIGPRGDMFTRLYDFDVSGHDAVFFKYSYEDQSGEGDGAPIQLPAEPWLRQPKIRGKITSAISISKFGVNAVHGRLRVAGRDDGESGFWQRDLAAPPSKGWRFHATGGKLPGKRLRNPPGDTSGRGLPPENAPDYTMDLAGTHAVISDFDFRCSPSTIEMTKADGTTSRLTLHTVDGLRQTVRAEDLDGTPRELYGAVEYPSGDIREVTVLATVGQLVIPELGWTFTRD